MAHQKGAEIFNLFKNSSLLAGSWTWLTTYFFDFSHLMESLTHLLSFFSFIILFFVNYPKMKKGFYEFKQTFAKNELRNKTEREPNAPRGAEKQHSEEA